MLKKVYLSPDVYYIELCNEIIEDALKILIEGYLGNPGNPVIK
jgi:hypothetical protein